MIIPDLAKRGAYYQAIMKPDDPAIGHGITDWTITYQYVDDLVVPGVGDAWGWCCSPAALPELANMTAEDVAAKRAHIAVRTPRTEADLPQIDRTIIHELGHLLVAPMQSTDIKAEENAMHSFDAVFAQLSPELGRFLARAMQNPRARAYRAGDGEMPDPVDDKKDKEKDKGGEPAKAQEGAPRDVAAIEMDIAKAQLAGQPIDALAKELALALVARGTQAAQEPGPASEPPPAPPASEMGMKQEDAYARARAEATREAAKEAIEGLIDANAHLTDGQKAVVRKQSTIALARELIKSYPQQPASPPPPPKMGLDGHPSTPAGGGKTMSPMARACAMPTDPEVRRARGYVDTSEETGGVSLDTPGQLVVMSLYTRAAEAKAKYQANAAQARGAK